MISGMSGATRSSSTPQSWIFPGGSSRQEKGQTRRKEDGSEGRREGRGRGSEYEPRLFIGAASVREEGALPKTGMGKIIPEPGAAASGRAGGES